MKEDSKTLTVNQPLILVAPQGFRVVQLKTIQSQASVTHQSDLRLQVSRNNRVVNTINLIALISIWQSQFVIDLTDKLPVYENFNTLSISILSTDENLKEATFTLFFLFR